MTSPAAAAAACTLCTRAHAHVLHPTPLPHNLYAARAGKCFLEVRLTPKIDADSAKVAPHGLIGQSFDGDETGVIGKTDEYKDGVVTTVAMGEGAIEGTHTDYVVSDKFGTDFKYSRFGKTVAAPRDAAALTGIKVRRGRVDDAGGVEAAVAA